MMRNRRYIFLSLTFLLMQFPFALTAQVLQKVQSSFDVHTKNVFQEKMFIHTSKEHYLCGELLWFKVYNVDANTNLFSDFSKVAYVDILDENNEPVMQAKVSLKNGIGTGSIKVPSILKNGRYKLRGYTNWMKNFGPSHFFEKQISLVNTLISPENSIKSQASVDIQFFPEGGELVEGLSSVVAFKAVNNENIGITMTGVILNQKNDTVARFQTHKFGIGSFKFTPIANHTYKAIATTSTKQIIIKELPAIKKHGYVIALADEKDDFVQVNVAITVAENSVYIFAHDGKKSSFAESISLTNGRGIVRIPKQKLGEGITHFTLFNEGGTAVAERLYFKRPTKKLNLAATADLSSYTTRQRVSIAIDAKNEKGLANIAEASISIRRLDSLQQFDQTDIVSYMWLSAELKGNIESPSYYFSDANESSVALDNLLLTQGWRRLIWDDVLSNKSAFQFLPEFNGHLIHGNIRGAKLKNMPIYLTIPNGARQFYHTQSDSTGNFIVNTKDLYGLNEIIVQTDANIDTTSSIAIKSPFSEQQTPFNFPKLEIKPSELNDLTIHSVGMQVQTIYAENKLEKFSTTIADSTKFYGTPYKSYNLDDYTRFSLMEDLLREYVTEAFIAKNQKHFQIKVLGKVNFFDGEPLVLVDGAPYFNMDRVMEINPKKIKTLDVIRDSYKYGPSFFKGILSFSSYKPSLANLEINPSAVVLDYEGMQLQREFYSPSYETVEKKNSSIPDFRNQLFWESSIPIDDKGKAKLNFYTSDQTGKYIGIINGLSKNGVPGTTTFTFEVK